MNTNTENPTTYTASLAAALKEQEERDAQGRPSAWRVYVPAGEATTTTTTTTADVTRLSLAKAARKHDTLPGAVWDYVRDCLARKGPTTEQAADAAIDAALREVFERSAGLEAEPIGTPDQQAELAAAATALLVDDDVEARILATYRRAVKREGAIYQQPSSGPRMDAEGYVELENAHGTLATLRYDRKADRVRFVCFGEREQGGAA